MGKPCEGTEHIPCLRARDYPSLMWPERARSLKEASDAALSNRGTPRFLLKRVLDELEEYVGISCCVTRIDSRVWQVIVEFGSRSVIEGPVGIEVASVASEGLWELESRSAYRLSSERPNWIFIPLEVLGEPAFLTLAGVHDVGAELQLLAIETSSAVAHLVRRERYEVQEALNATRFDSLGRLTADLVDPHIGGQAWLKRVTKEASLLKQGAGSRYWEALSGRMVCRVAVGCAPGMAKTDFNTATEVVAEPVRGDWVSRGVWSHPGASSLDLLSPEEESVALIPLARNSGPLVGILQFVHPHPFALDDLIMESLSQLASLAMAGIVYRLAKGEMDANEEEARRLAGILERLADGVGIVNGEGTLFYLNESFARMHAARVDELIGVPAQTLVLPDARRRASRRSELSGGTVRGDQVRRRLDGSTFIGETIERPFHDVQLGFKGTLVSVRDVSKRAEQEVSVSVAAWTDALTGLYNRVGFFAEATELLAACPAGETVGLLFVDLDGLKLVNDQYGHVAGDQVLNEIAQRIGVCLRGEDIVGRIGGDEFAVLLAQVDSIGGARLVANRVAAAISDEAVVVGAKEVRMTAAVGVSTGRAGEVTLDELISHADTQMYRDKFSRRSAEMLHLGGVDVTAVEMELGPDLVRVLRGDPSHGHLFLVYQPIFHLPDRLITGVEALVRWQHYREGQLSPDRFLPLALQFRLLDRLDDYVRSAAVAGLVQWESSGIRLSVNLSGINAADQSVVRSFVSLIEKHDIDPERVVVELTESELSDAFIARISRVVGRLKAEGFKIALDDFGVGTSSFRHLQVMPVDVVKIDRQFVRRLETAPARRLVKALSALARTLNLEVVAEGVQDAVTLRILEDLGIDSVQGFLLSKPLRAEAVSRMLERQAKGAMLKA